MVVALPALALALVLSLAWAGLQALFSGSTSDLSDRLLIIMMVTFFLLYTGYETFALLRWRQTIGKRIMGLKVGPVSGVGRLGPLQPTAVMVRSAVFVFPVLLFFLPAFVWWLLIAVVALFTGGMAAWDLPNHQGVHDKVAGTMVLDVR